MKEEKALVIGKKIECILGIIFMIPPFIAVFCFLLNWFGMADGYFVEMSYLGGMWDYHYDQGGASSPAPIYLGLMAIAGAYLVKDSFKYLFYKVSKEDK
jgi:hypothetical protein